MKRAFAFCGIFGLTVGGLVLGAFAADDRTALPKEIVMEGGNRYDGHLQGTCTDGKHIYWSMTWDLVKTDLAGKELAHYRNHDFHMGDLCWHKDRIYVGINRTAEDGCRRGDEVWVFEPEKLERVKVIPTPQTVWCNNGIEWYGGRFWVIGSAPTDIEYNFVFEYTEDFRFVQCRPIKSGPMNHGVQTVCLKDDVMYFGCYGLKDVPGNTFGVNVKDLTRPSRSIEFPYVVPISSRFQASAAEGMFVLGGQMWIGRGTDTKQAEKKPDGQPKRLFGARAYPVSDFDKEKTK